VGVTNDDMMAVATNSLRMLTPRAFAGNRQAAR